MEPLFGIGYFYVNIFGFFVALGVLVGTLISIKEAKRNKFDIDTLLNVIIIAILGGVLGARMYYVLAFNLEYYLNNPIKIFAIRDGGLSIQGGLIGGIAFSLVYAKIKKINVLKIADIIAPGLILGQAVGRIGCDVLGVKVSTPYPWAVNVSGDLFHPAQIYESILNYILFGVLWARRKSIKYDGQLFFTYLIGFSINRFIVEFFRSNPIVFKQLTVAHFTSVVMIVITLMTMYYLRKKYGNDEKRFKRRFAITLREIMYICAMIIISVRTYYWIW